VRTDTFQMSLAWRGAANAVSRSRAAQDTRVQSQCLQSAQEHAQRCLAVRMVPGLVVDELDVEVQLADLLPRLWSFSLYEI